MSSFIVRKARPEDAAEAVDAVRASITELCVADHRNSAAILEHWLRNKTVDNFVKWISNPERFCVVAERHGHVIGVGLLANVGTIHLCYLRPGTQGLGVGRAILHALEAQACALGLKEIHLESSVGSQAGSDAQGGAGA